MISENTRFTLDVRYDRNADTKRKTLSEIITDSIHHSDELTSTIRSKIKPKVRIGEYTPINNYTASYNGAIHGYPSVEVFIDSNRNSRNDGTSIVGAHGRYTNLRQDSYVIKPKLTFKDISAKERFIDTMASIHDACDDKSFFMLDDQLRVRGCVEVSLSSNDPMVIIEFSFSSLSREYTEKVKAMLLDCFVTHNSANQVLMIDSVGSSGLNTRKIDIMKEEETAQPCFYPWMQGVSVQEYFTDFLNSKENLMILYGPPGTAKTTMVRTAIKSLGISTMMASNAQITSDATFVASLIQYMEQTNTNIEMVVLEDADAMMRHRSEGNLSLNALLSYLDGIGSTNKKLVIISNCDNLDGIDPALLRHGRCFDINRFGRLSFDEANVVRKAIGKPPLLPSEVKWFTIAQITSDNGTNTQRSGSNGNCSIVSPRFPLSESRSK